jgi:FkbM family methyltransferase
MESRKFRHRVIDTLRNVPVLGGWVGWACKWQYHYNDHPTTRLKRLIGKRENLFIVEVGSNDGKSGDPLYSLIRSHRSWQALFVEPVPFLFEQLRRNHGDNPRFRYEQVAIADRPQTLPFYYVSPDARRDVSHLPAFCEQIGSFYRANVEKHMAGKLDKYIVEMPVEAVPLATVLERQQVHRIDVLLIDTEGYDWQVLRQLDLSRYSPFIIFFEHKFLSPEDKAASREFLSAYDITDLGHDYLCQRRDT